MEKVNLRPPMLSFICHIWKDDTERKEKQTKPRWIVNSEERQEVKEEVKRHFSPTLLRQERVMMENYSIHNGFQRTNKLIAI